MIGNNTALGPQIVLLLYKLMNAVCEILPLDPFNDAITALENAFRSQPRTHWIDWLNWFIPIDFCLGAISAWLACVLLVYAVLAVGRLIGLFTK